MVISIHQPMYLPWLAFFDKLVASDVFVLLDSVQFERNSFINRNYVKTAQGRTLLTVPVSLGGHTDETIRTTRIADQRFAAKHLKTISQSYARAPNAQLLLPELERLYAVEYETIAQLNEEHLRFWMRWLGIERELIRSSEIETSGTGSDLVLSICQELDADRYISGRLGRDYLDVSSFEAAGVDVEFQDFTHPSYPQLHGEFIAGLGVVDYAMA